MLASQTNNGGFTLIELSIVLVVIGLIIGGILVGRDLIHSAEIRATLSQVEKYNTAVNTFKLKYNCLPGDCLNASDYGFDATSNGNGDGRIGCDKIANCNFGVTLPFQMEATNVWYHLSAANLIADAIAFANGADPPSMLVGTGTPPSKIVAKQHGGYKSGGWLVATDVFFDTAYGGGGFISHSLVLSGESGAVPALGATYGYYPPADTYAIDAKIDDGLPLSGSVRAYYMAVTDLLVTFKPYYGGEEFMGQQFGLGPGGPNAAVCVNTTPSPAQYNVQYFGSNNSFGSCGVVIKAAF